MTVTDAQEPPAFAKPQQEQRYERLERFANVVIDWHCHVAKATPQQRQELQRALLAQAVTIAKQASFRQENYTRAAFASTRPNAGRVLLEGRAWKRGPSAWDKALQATLSEPQNEAISALLVRRRVAGIQRSAAATAAYLQHIANLTDKQSKDLQTHLLNQLGTDLLAQPLSVATLPQLRLLDDFVLSRAMKGRSEAVRRQLRGQSIDSELKYNAALVVQSDNASEAKKTKAIERAIQPAMEQAELTHQATILLIAKRYKLDAKSRRRLTLAAKGVRARCKSRWSRALSEQYDKTEEQLQRVMSIYEFVLNAPLTVPALREDRILARALEQVIATAVASGTRSTAFQQGLVQQQLVIFDSELWLRPDQQQAFAKLLESAVGNSPPAETVAQLSNLVTRIAKRLPEAEVKALLTPNQMTVLKFLQNATPVR